MRKKTASSTHGTGEPVAGAGAVMGVEAGALGRAIGAAAPVADADDDDDDDEEEDDDDEDDVMEGAKPGAVSTSRVAGVTALPEPAPAPAVIAASAELEPSGRETACDALAEGAPAMAAPDSSAPDEVAVTVAGDGVGDVKAEFLVEPL